MHRLGSVVSMQSMHTCASVVMASFAASGFLSRILMFMQPGSRIQQQKQKRMRKKLLSYLLKLFYFKQVQKKIWASKNYSTFYPKIVTKPSKIWVWDPNPEFRKNLSRIQGSKRHRIPDPDPQHWLCLVLTHELQITIILWNRHICE